MIKAFPFWQLVVHGYRFPVKVVSGVACSFVLIYDVIMLVIWRWLPPVREFLFTSLNYAAFADFITSQLKQNGYCHMPESDINKKKTVLILLCSDDILDDYIEMVAYTFYYTESVCVKTTEVKI